MAEITKSMTITKINNVLAKGGNITFKAGTYDITDTLILCNNSNIKCEKGVEFKKKTPKAILMTKVAKTTTAYKGAHDITWDGGTFIGNTNTSQSNMISIVHAKNVTLKNMDMQKCVALHFIEVNASQNVDILGCVFSDHVTKAGKEHKECIQIDYAGYDGLAYANKTDKTYDGTHCQNIKIYRCIFKNNLCCIGTHTVSTLDKAHKNIVIEENVAIGRDSNKEDCVFAKILNFNGVEITGNCIEAFNKGIFVNRMATGHFNSGGTQKLSGYKYSANITARNNMFKNCLTDMMIK